MGLPTWKNSGGQKRELEETGEGARKRRLERWRAKLRNF